MIDIRLLRHVLALNKHRNFIRAADSLHISQPALSRSIAGLEQELGFLLFDRMSSGLQPTPLGQMIIERGQGIINQEKELLREILFMQGMEVGEFSVGAGPFPFENSVCEAIARLIAQHPRLQVRVNSNSPPVIINQVIDGDIDLGVVDVRLCQGDTRLSIEPLPNRTIVCCCRRGHPLAGKRSLELAEILSFPIVGTVFSPALANLLSAGGLAGRVDEASGSFLPAITVDSLSAAKKIALGCDALLPITPNCVDAELQSGDLVIIDFNAPWMQSTYGFVAKRDRTLAPAALAFIELVKQIEAESVERANWLLATYANYSKLA
jgi:DNA-binding transcriptional LysR family regulator